MAAPHPLTRACALAVTALAVAGCSRVGASSSPPGTTIHVTERDFRITLDRSQAPAGEVSFVDRNRGPDTHELIVVRATGGRLPLRGDGITLDEDALKPRTLGEIDGAPPGTTQVLRVRLRPGRYVLFCNMLGHYMAGMHAELTVR
jgi:uncharacterized cupredoxin-like copper-binding protein